MKTLNSIVGVLLLLTMTVAISAFSSNAMAQVSIDQLQVQGFMQQSNGNPVTNTTAVTCSLGGGVGSGYAMAFGVSKVIAGVTTTIWGGEQCVTVQNGLFAVTLQGVGSNLGATGANLPAGTVGASMAQNFSGTGLNANLNAALLAGASGELSVLVYAVDAINSLHPFWTIPIMAVPTAMLAQEAVTVLNHSINFNSLATAGVYFPTSTGAAGFLPQLNGSGQLDQTFLPGGASGLPVGGGGTGATTLTQNGVVLGNGTNPMTATAAGTNNTVLHGNTGAAPTYSSVSLTADVSGTLPVTSGGTGLAAFTQGDMPFASAANTLSALGIGASGKILNSTGTAPQWSTSAGLNLAASGANADITSANSMTSASSLATVGTITSGTWTGTTIAVANGGTGATSGPAALTALGAAPAAGSGSVTTLGTVTAGTWNATTIAVNHGGTGATTGPAALTSLGAAASGANGDITSATALTTANALTSASTLAAVGTITTGVWNGTAVGAQFGGTGLNTSAATGVGIVTAGTWSTPATLSSTLGGTGLNTSAATGVPIVTAGTWTTPAQLAVGQGGTGLSTYTAAGAIPVSTAATTLAALPIGTTGQVLTVSGGAPAWVTPDGGSRSGGIYLWEDFVSGTTAAINVAATFMSGTALVWSTATTIGSINAAAPTAFHLGVLNINTGTAAAKNTGVGFCTGTSTAGTVVGNTAFSTTDNWTFTASLSINPLANTGSTWIGLLSTFPTTLVTNNANAGVFFEVLNASLANINAYSRGGSVTIAGNSGTLTANTFTNYTITYTGSTTTLQAFQNGTLMMTNNAGLATTIPSGTTALCPSVQHASDTAGATNEIQLDYIGYQQSTTVANGDR